MGLKFGNFCRAKLATPPSGTGGLSFTVEAGKGALFPTLSAGDYAYLVFKNADKSVNEVVKVEARSTDAFTIATGGRGLDGTTAQTWTANDYVELCMTNIALAEVFNAAVTTIGALTPAADRYPYYSSATAAALGTITAFARTVLDDADAATARTTLGAAASGANSDITSVAVNNSGLTAKDTDNSHVLVFRPGSNLTANRNFTVTTGDADRTLTLTADLTVSATATVSGTNTGDVSAASQADQETATSTTTFVSPGRQQFHPSAAKAWCIFDGTGALSVAASYNMDGVTPVTDNGTGDYTLNWGTDFSSANYAVIGTCFWESTSGNADQVVHVGTQVGGGANINTVAGANGTKVDNRRVCVAAFGDQ